MSANDNIDPLDSLDDILDKSIDDLKDLPEFKSPHTGIYKLSMTAQGKMIAEKPAVEFNFLVKECVSLEDDTLEETERSKAGDKFGVAIFLRNEDGTVNEIGEGRMKEMMAPLVKHFGAATVKACIREHLNAPVDVTCKVTRKERKKDKGKFDAQISELVVD